MCNIISNFLCMEDCFIVEIVLIVVGAMKEEILTNSFLKFFNLLTNI